MEIPKKKEVKVANPDKGIYPIAIYDFIKKNSDDQRHLTVSDIIRHLRKYSAGIDEKSIKRTVLRHMDGICQYDEKIHIILKNGEENYRPAETSTSEILEIYYDQPFSANDLRILSDAVIYSRHLKRSDREDLLEKIAMLRPSHSNKWFMNALHESNEQTRLETELFRNLDVIDDAIANKQCLDFLVMDYGADRKLHQSESIAGFRPYIIFIDGNTYYVIGMTEESKIWDETQPVSSPYIKQGKGYHVFRYPIHRLRKIKKNDNYEYVDINETMLKNKSLKDICEANYTWYEGLFEDSQHLSTNVEFIAHSRGLNALVESFGNRIIIQKMKPETYPDGVIGGERYLVTLKQAWDSDWRYIISLCDKYSSYDIMLKSHHERFYESLNYISEHTKERPLEII